MKSVLDSPRLEPGTTPISVDRAAVSRAANSRAATFMPPRVLPTLVVLSLTFSLLPRRPLPHKKGVDAWVEQNRGTRPTSPQTVPRLAAMFAARPAPSAVPRFLSGVKSPTRSSVTVSSNLRRARRTSTALSVACSSLRQKPGEQLLCCSHTLHS